RQITGGNQFHAVGRTRERRQLDFDPVLGVPAELVGDGEGGRRRGYGARAPADFDHGLRRRLMEREGAEGGEGDSQYPVHSVPPFARSRSSAAFSDGSQNRTRRRKKMMHLLSSSPTIDRMISTENCPATSMVKFMLWISMPKPDSAPTNSATIEPI